MSPIEQKSYKQELINDRISFVSVIDCIHGNINSVSLHRLSVRHYARTTSYARLVAQAPVSVKLLLICTILFGKTWHIIVTRKVAKPRFVPLNKMTAGTNFGKELVVYSVSWGFDSKGEQRCQLETLLKVLQLES